MANPKVCPLCKQPLPSTDHKRVCANCHKPIGLHDKWYFTTVDQQTIIQHRDCGHPTSYIDTNNKKALLNQLELANDS